MCAGRTISVPILSHSHKTIATHSHVKNLFPFPFLPYTTIRDPMPITVMKFLEISKAKKCVTNSLSPVMGCRVDVAAGLNTQ